LIASPANNRLGRIKRTARIHLLKVSIIFSLEEFKVCPESSF